MTRLTLADIADEQPVRLTLSVSTRLHRELQAYSVAVNQGEASGAPAVARLIPLMLERFLAADRGFAAARRRS